MTLPPLVGVVAFFELTANPGIIPRLLSRLTGLSQSTFVFEGMAPVIMVHAYSFSVASLSP